MRSFLRLRREKPAPYKSFLDGVREGALHGWAVNVKEPAEPARVSIYHNGDCIGETTAMHFRQDLVRPSLGLGHGNYAFAFAVPPRIRVLREYTLSAVLDGAVEILGSPVAVVEPSQFPMIDGAVDGIHGGTLEGWAVDNMNPTEPAKVRIFQDSDFLGEVAASAFRDDLRKATIGQGHGNYGFNFKIPESVRAQRKYTVAAQVGDLELRGSPVTVYESDDFPFRTTGLHVRDFLVQQYLHGSGIEIGALDKPALVPVGTRVQYVDSKPAEQLREFYKTELHGHALLQVDIVADAQTLDPVATGSQDFVIANQVLEHLENTLLSLENMLRVLKPGGVLFISLPDKRYSFDVDRPVTEFSHLLADYRSGPEGGREAHYREWIELVEKLPPAEIPARLDFLQNILCYPIHYHVWTPYEMFQMFDQSRAVLPYAYEIECVKTNEAETLFVLRRV
jgi:SAM-dependent methyltransferase